MRGVCTSPWCSAAFGTEKDVSAAAATFVLLIGQRKEAVAQQLPGTSKVCTPRNSSNQVIIKTGTVASPASWNVYVRRHKRETDQTCDGVIEKWCCRSLKMDSILMMVHWQGFHQCFCFEWLSHLLWCLCMVVWHINRAINHFILLYLCTILLTRLCQQWYLHITEWCRQRP